MKMHESGARLQSSDPWINLMKQRHALLVVLAGAAGGGAAIGVKEALSARSTIPVMAIPFATSIVLVMGSPEVEAAQPRALIGGHILSTAIGLFVSYFVGPEP
jgi:CBS-domain-containing membrane protein